MTIRKIWKQVNVSTLLVLPIFNSIVEGTKVRYPKIEFPFLRLAYEYGLINSFLYVNGILRVAFTPKVIENLKLTDSDYYSLNERILDYKYCCGVERVDDIIIYDLTIPKHFISDVKLIREGKYSKVSKHYKDTLLIKQKFIVKWDNKIGSYILTHNLPYSIVTKQLHLKEEMIDRIGSDFPDSQEFYPPFDLERETLPYV